MDVKSLERTARRVWQHSRREVAEPGHPPAGWRVGPPDFVGVGVQRAGTTWWWKLLLDHPLVTGPMAMRRRLPVREQLDSTTGVRAPRISLRKELHFFDSAQAWRPSPARAALYGRFFPRPPGSIAGEWTPRYMYDFWVPRLLRAAAPDAKLLVLLRDPLDRLLSGLALETKQSRQVGARPSPLVWNEALDRGRYHGQLSLLLEHFPREQILVLQYERCRRHPQEELQRTYRFIGAEPVDHLPDGLETYGGRALPKPALDDDLRAQVVAALEEEVRAVAELVPEIDLALWSNFSHLSQ